MRQSTYECLCMLNKCDACSEVLETKEQLRKFDYSVELDAAPFEFPDLRPANDRGVYPDGCYVIKEPSDFQVRDGLETIVEYRAPRDGFVPTGAFPKPLDKAKGVEWREWLDLAGAGGVHSVHSTPAKLPSMTPERALEEHRAFMRELYANSVMEEESQAHNAQSPKSKDTNKSEMGKTALKMLGTDSEAEEVTQSDAEREDDENEEEEEVIEDSEEEEPPAVAKVVKASARAGRLVKTSAAASHSATDEVKGKATTTKRSARSPAIKSDPDFVFDGKKATQVAATEQQGTPGRKRVAPPTLLVVSAKKNKYHSKVVYDSDASGDDATADV
jgi:hypothetical protein